jgi:shikimate dehydrogenase
VNGSGGTVSSAEATTIGASTRLFAVLGDPVGHSLSPTVQNAAIRAAGLDAVYVALRCDARGLEGLMRGIALAGGGGNVTVPHKEAAVRAVDVPSELVRTTGACNTFWARDGVIHGDNTDVPGFRGALGSLLGGSPRGLRALLLGAGGAARGALVGLLLDEVASVAVWNRTFERAERLCVELGRGRAKPIGSLAEGGDFDLLVNGTSVGLSRPDDLPLDLDRVHVKAVLDLVYRPEETALVRAARDRGMLAADGGEMLVRQGAEAFERWWDGPAPLRVMLDALASVRSKRG